MITQDSKDRMLAASRRGHKTRRTNIAKALMENIHEYNKHPRLCGNCLSILPYLNKQGHKSRQKFCSKSCAASFNNIGIVRHGESRAKSECVVCGNIIINRNSLKYCSRQCCGIALSSYSLKKNSDAFANGHLSDDQARTFFRRISKKVCSICGLSEWMGKEIPLVADHIDGDRNNNFPRNFRMVCCNCDAQLPTYKSKNRTLGRLWRKQYYSKENKSRP